MEYTTQTLKKFISDKNPPTNVAEAVKVWMQDYNLRKMTFVGVQAGKWFAPEGYTLIVTHPDHEKALSVEIASQAGYDGSQPKPGFTNVPVGTWIVYKVINMGKWEVGIYYFS